MEWCSIPAGSIFPWNALVLNILTSRIYHCLKLCLWAACRNQFCMPSIVSQVWHTLQHMHQAKTWLVQDNATNQYYLLVPKQSPTQILQLSTTGLDSTNVLISLKAALSIVLRRALEPFSQQERPARMLASSEYQHVWELDPCGGAVNRLWMLCLLWWQM